MKPILFNTEMVRAILDERKTATRRIAAGLAGTQCNSGHDHEFVWDNFAGGEATGFVCRRCGCGVSPPRSKYPVGTSWIRPQYKPGDVLYVRETWGSFYYDDPESNAEYFMYRADYPAGAKGYWYEPEHIHFCDFPRWRPSIHMPKEAARLFLRVTNVRLERLHQMKIKDFVAEGIIPKGISYLHRCHCPSYEEGCRERPCQNRDGLEEWRYLVPFAELWDKTVPKESKAMLGYHADPWVWVIEFERISREEAHAL